MKSLSIASSETHPHLHLLKFLQKQTKCHSPLLSEVTFKRTTMDNIRPLDHSGSGRPFHPSHLRLHYQVLKGCGFVKHRREGDSRGTDEAILHDGRPRGYTYGSGQ